MINWIELGEQPNYDCFWNSYGHGIHGYCTLGPPKSLRTPAQTNASRLHSTRKLKHFRAAWPALVHLPTGLHRFRKRKSFCSFINIVTMASAPMAEQKHLRRTFAMNNSNEHRPGENDWTLWEMNYEFRFSLWLIRAHFCCRRMNIGIAYCLLGLHFQLRSPGLCLLSAF